MPFNTLRALIGGREDLRASELGGVVLGLILIILGLALLLLVNWLIGLVVIIVGVVLLVVPSVP